MFSIDIDVGGTFTDGFFTDGETFKTAKVLTTPHDVTEGFMDCVRSGSDLFGLKLDDFLRRTSVARLSTTIGTNLLVQRKGARVGLIVTSGQEEKLYCGDRAVVLDNVVDAQMIKGVAEAVDDEGNCVLSPRPEDVLSAVRDLVQDGAQIIVVSFENAWRNPDNEIAVRGIIRNRYPTHYLRSVTVQLGSEVLQHSDDHARTNSAILNAYIHSDMARALFRAEDRIRDAGLAKPLLIVHASGGNARVAKTVALNTLHSGPAVAVKGAAVIATVFDHDHIVSADMGGTSFDIGVVVDRQANLDHSPSVDGISIAIPTIHVDSAGIGGGSIAWLDDAQTLKVGPRSAGSAPGPAAYGKGGTEPTVTDANVVLGFVDPDNFLGGKMKLDLEAARRVIERRIARKLNVSVERAAFEIRRLANEHMGNEIKSSLKANGVPPEETMLLSVGGAGPLHACEISSAAGLKGALALPFGSVFSAFGGSQTNVQHYYRHTFVPPEAKQSELASSIARLLTQAARDMRGEGFAEYDVTCRAYSNSGTALVHTNNAKGDATSISKDLQSQATGPTETIELVVEAAVPRWSLTPRSASGQLLEPRALRDVFWQEEAATETAIFNRDDLTSQYSITGPAIVEGEDTTYAISPGWSLAVDPLGGFTLSRDATVSPTISKAETTEMAD